MQGALQWSGKQNGFCLECHLVRASPAYHGLDPPSSKIVLKRGTVPAGNWSFDRGQAGTVYTTEHVPVHFIAKKKRSAQATPAHLSLNQKKKGVRRLRQLILV